MVGSTMELFRTQQYYILLNKDSTLWINRISGELQAKAAWELANGQDLECLGVFHGLVGRVKYDNVNRFILIRDIVLVGTVPLCNEVYKIKSIVLLNPSTDDMDDLGLRICAKHNYEDFLTLSAMPESTSTGNSAFARAWGNVKSATLNQLKTNNIQSNAQSKGPSLNYKENSNLSKNERRIEEEILRIFTDSDSFYYCPSNKGDITNSVLRQGGELDDRFFWNKHMLSDIMDIDSDFARAWVCPIIQGYVEIAPIYKGELSLILISRRSRFRAGTRYKRRGLNAESHCANYVETEQIISYKSHAVSFVQVRGSVPLFWSQPGIKYRPAPILHKNLAENQSACEKHFEEQLKLYSKVIIVNLVEQLGKESIIFNAYTQHVLSLNNPDLVYVCFDFHEYCRGMHFERVSLLTDKLKEESIFRDMGYSWKDKQGLICTQKSIFRVNCIDCLDRTNVVQTALARTVLIRQLKKLGIVSPDGDLPRDINVKFQVMWANNGDIISKQYAGTAALKGDFTRTGDRKFSGLMKDGMTSANRYYLSRFKDNIRQACLDIMCGELDNIDEKMSSDEDDEEDNNNGNSEEEEATYRHHINTLIEDCKRLMLTEEEHLINAWPLIAADEVTTGLCGEDFDRILILTKDMLKIAEYNVHLDSIALLVCVPLGYVKEISLGPLLKATSTPVSSARPQPHTTSRRLYMRLILSSTSVEKNSPSSAKNPDGQSLILTSSRVHYFNNQASIVKSIDEKNEALRAVTESLSICMRLGDCPLDVQYCPIDLAKSPRGNAVVNNAMPLIKKQSDAMLPQPIQMEIGTEEVDSHISNIGFIRSNSRIDATDVDLNDIFIDENITLDVNSKAHDLSLTSSPNPSLTSGLQLDSAPSIPSAEPVEPSVDNISTHPSTNKDSTPSDPERSEPNLHPSRQDVPSPKESVSDFSQLSDQCSTEEKPGNGRQVSTLSRSWQETQAESNKHKINETSTSIDTKNHTSKVDLSDSSEPSDLSSATKPNPQRSVIVKLNSCDLDGNDLTERQNDTAHQKSHLTLTLKQNKSNENLATHGGVPKIVKSSSEKDLKSADLAKSQSDDSSFRFQGENSSLRQNLKTVMVSPTNALSKLVTKGVANLNSLDPRRRLSVQKLASPGEERKMKEKLEEKWKKSGCRSKLIVL